MTFCSLRASPHKYFAHPLWQCYSSSFQIFSSFLLTGVFSASELKMNFRPTSLAPLSIPLLLALLLQLNSSFASTASVLSINRPSQEDTPIEKTNLNKHAACGDDCNDEYIENWYASILYPKLKTGNHEPEIFYWGDTMVVNYISSFDDPILNIYCYQDEAHTTENGSWGKFLYPSEIGNVTLGRQS